MNTIRFFVVLLALVSVSSLHAQPLNDDCAAATVIAGPLTPLDYDTTTATTDGPDLAVFCDPGPGSDDQIYNDVWFSWTSPADGELQLEFVNLNPGARAAIYVSACPAPAGNVIACTDLPFFLSGVAGTLEAPVMGGTTYLIRVGGSNPASSLKASSRSPWPYRRSAL